MSIEILNVLSDGPTPYGEFIKLGLHPGYADVHLRLLRKQRKVRLDSEGRYHIPAEPPKDGKLWDNHTVYGHCQIGSAALYRKKAKYCGRECMAVAKTKERKVCKRPGCERTVKEHDHRFCSIECRSAYGWKK